MGITSTRSINRGMDIQRAFRSMISRYRLSMQRITRDQLTPVFDRRVPPVARVKPGEIFWVETEDSRGGRTRVRPPRSEEHTSELQSRSDLVCRLLLEKKKNIS